MAKLAEDSVNRIIDYNKRNAKEKFSVALITKGIILGNSKKYKHTSTDIPHIKAGHTLKYKNSLLNTEDLFNEVGLVTIKNDLSADKYYIKRNTNSNKYGYRRLFQWELDNKFELAKKLNIDYHEDKYPTEEYKYILKLDEKTTEEIKNTLLNKINNQDPALIEKRLTKEFERTNYKTEEIFIKLAEQIDENFESLESCINNHHNLIKENLNKIEIQAEKIQKGTKRYHEEDSQQRKKISRSIEKGQKEIKDIFNKMVNRIEEIAVNKKNECLKGPISFSVKDPIKLFTGREQELCDLHKKMQESKQTVISQITTISGLGGIGKTELARRYISQYGQFYDNNIIWVNGESESTIIQSFNKLAQYKLKISIEDQDKRKKDIKSIVNDVYELFSKRKSLFVFDNAENNKTLKEILPIRVLSHENNIPYILITSRIAEVEWTLWGIEKSITLKVFTDEEAINFVKESLKLKEKNDDILNEQVRELTISLLHKFPLALQQAVAYIKKENEKIKLRKKGEYTITDYLKDYKKETKKLLNTETFKNLDNDYSQTTLKTWKVTTDKIKSNTEYGQIALEILDIIAYLAPNNIPIEMIFSLNIDEEKLWSAVELLYRYSMIKLKEGKCDVHRLVQEVTRLNFIGQDREKEIIEKTFYYLKEAFSNREISETKKQLLPHLEEFYSHLQNWSEKYTETTEMEKYKSDLLIWIANGYESFGNYNKQRSLLIQTLKIQKKYCDPDSLEIVETLERLGLIEEELGYYYEQNNCFKKALRIKRIHYDSDSLEISKTLENLASSYGNLGLEYNNTYYHNKRIINLTNALEMLKYLIHY
ncbi:MAG: hypothetical protein KTV77_00785 [Wolbachia endosymbiont of Fragariocoptes setiger]|nr:hypothetical protein [Wolbachia endosymbiont of Fragariocoptes setiger]